MPRSHGKTRHRSSFSASAGRTAATVREPGRSPHPQPLSTRGASEARAWLARQLRWEDNLAELRADHERADNPTDSPTSPAERP